MSRASLIKLYNGLAMAGPRAAERRRVLGLLGLEDTIPDEPLHPDTITNDQYRNLLQDLAVSNQAEPDSEGRINKRVLEVERLEFLVALSQSFQDKGASLSEVNAEVAHLAAGVAVQDWTPDKEQGPVQATEQYGEQVAVLGERIDLAAATARPTVSWQGGGVPKTGPQPKSAAPATAVASVLASGVASAAFGQPTGECRGCLIEVDFNQPLHGAEYAVFIESKLSYPTTDVPAFLQGVREHVFDPLDWPQCNDFWCDMTMLVDQGVAVPGSIPDAGLLAQLEAESAGRDVIWEEVGDCPVNGDWFRDTYIRFGTDGTPPTRMTYQLLPIATSALHLDDGVIELHESTDRVDIMITKSLYVNGALHRTEGQVIAEFACESGWLLSTRTLIDHCVALGQYP